VVGAVTIIVVPAFSRLDAPSNTRVEPAATTIMVAFQHPAAAAHARER
jgi:hypothetical protein